MNLFRTRKLFGIDQLTRIHHPHMCRRSTTPPAGYLPPLDTLCDNHPELTVHPRMNSRSEQRALHCVSTPIAIHLSCHAYVCYDCFVFTVSSPFYSSVDPAATADYTAAEYDYVVDDRTPSVELPGKQSHSLPQIFPIFPYISCTRHCYCCCYNYNPTQLHSLFLSPLDVPSVILCCLLYILYSAVSPAHC